MNVQFWELFFLTQFSHYSLYNKYLLYSLPCHKLLLQHFLFPNVDALLLEFPQS